MDAPTALPNEIIYEFFIHATAHPSTRANQKFLSPAGRPHAEELVSYSLVCKQWRYISQFLLFDSVELTLRPDRKRSLESFGDFLRESPHAAESIRTLTIRAAPKPLYPVGAKVTKDSKSDADVDVGSLQDLIGLMPRLKEMSLSKLRLGRGGAPRQGATALEKKTVDDVHRPSLSSFASQNCDLGADDEGAVWDVLQTFSTVNVVRLTDAHASSLQPLHNAKAVECRSSDTHCYPVQSQGVVMERVITDGSLLYSLPHPITGVSHAEVSCAFPSELESLADFLRCSSGSMKSLKLDLLPFIMTATVSGPFRIQLHEHLLSLLDAGLLRCSALEEVELIATVSPFDAIGSFRPMHYGFQSITGLVDFLARLTSSLPPSVRQVTFRLNHLSYVASLWVSEQFKPVQDACLALEGLRCVHVCDDELDSGDDGTLQKDWVAWQMDELRQKGILHPSLDLADRCEFCLRKTGHKSNM